MIEVQPLTKDDLPEMYTQLRSSPGYLNKTRWAVTTQQDQFCQHFLQLMRIPNMLIFVINIEGRIAGSIEIKVDSDSYVIGYWLGAEFQGQGIMTMAIQDLLQHKLKDRNSVVAEVSVDNLQSSAVLMRLGFCEVGRNDTWVHYKKIIFQ